MIKVISAANQHPTNRTRADFFQYWRQRHGPLFARTPELSRYVQHFSVAEAYAGDPAPTHDGASMFWYEELDALRNAVSPRLGDIITSADGDLYQWYVASARYGSPESITLQETVRADDRQLFDRSGEWPTHTRRATVLAQERVIVDGAADPSMLKVIYIASRKPGLSLDEFQQHWFAVHGELGSRVPGLRRYVQNHGLPEAYSLRPMTHDGFSELWFDDLASLQRARASAEWSRLSEDGQTLFTYPMAVVVAHEGVIKG
jgi:uncharacterized protein (TIGR02118 family)